jgi:NTP pyrophosphatase (non-canonical NTP hydrolase)
MQISELVNASYKNAKGHGFWEDFKIIQDIVDDIEYGEKCDMVNKTLKINAICTRLSLIHDEVSEAVEGLRKDDIDNFKEELADVVIRVADLSGGLGIDLEAEIKKKMEINKSRPWKHGKTF